MYVTGTNWIECIIYHLLYTKIITFYTLSLFNLLNYSEIESWGGKYQN